MNGWNSIKFGYGYYYYNRVDKAMEGIHQNDVNVEDQDIVMGATSVMEMDQELFQEIPTLGKGRCKLGRLKSDKSPNPKSPYFNIKMEKIVKNQL